MKSLVFDIKDSWLHSWDPTASFDTHIGKIACHGNCTPDGLFMQFGQKLHASAIFCCMQFHRDGCLSTRLDFRNHVLRDERLGQNKTPLFLKKENRLYFPLYFLKFPLYLQNWLALSEIVILGPETLCVAFWYLCPWHTEIGTRNSKNLILWHTLIGSPLRGHYEGYQGMSIYKDETRSKWSTLWSNRCSIVQ